MRNKSSSSKQNIKSEPRLSGAYIRTLVKQLSSSRLKDPASANTNSPDSNPQVDPQPQPPPPPHKKQVRRRLHTSRPYQERLLNMAEARREIVTALKFHRASMKQAANEPHQQQQQQQTPTTCPNYPNPNFLAFPNYVQTPMLPPFHYPPLLPYPTTTDGFNLALPNQPLGLNLNIQGFNDIETPSTTQQASPEPAASTVGPADACAVELHRAMDEEGMAEIRTIGEKHDIEWSDTVNLVTSAWWSSFLGTMEGSGADVPAFWLGGDLDHGLLMQHLDEYYLQDASLPCLDIGEIEGLQGEWLSKYDHDLI